MLINSLIISKADEIICFFSSILLMIIPIFIRLLICLSILIAIILSTRNVMNVIDLLKGIL